MFFLTLGGSIQSFTINYTVSYGFTINALYQVKEFPFYSWFVESCHHEC